MRGELDEALRDDDQPEPIDPVFLFEGDVAEAKVVHTVQFDGLDSWFTYGVKSRLQPGETEEELYHRLSTVVNARSLDLALDAKEPIEQIHEQTAAELRQRRARRPIQP